MNLLEGGGGGGGAERGGVRRALKRIQSFILKYYALNCFTFQTGLEIY